MPKQLSSPDPGFPASGGLFPSQMQRTTQRELERTIGGALITRAREQARAVLTAEVLEVAGALSSEQPTPR